MPAYHDDPGKNIFDTYDPLCDGSDASIILCDGFEDEAFLVGHLFGTDCGGGNCLTQNDYWSQQDFAPIPDPEGRDYAECRPGAIDTAVANYGAAGTRCAATTGWGDDHSGYSAVGQQGFHRIVISNYTPGVGHPGGGDPASSPAQGPTHIGARFYVQMVGTASNRCPSYPVPCPAFALTGGSSGNPNGWKFVELEPTFTIDGINGVLMGSWNKVDSVDEGRDLFMLEDSSCTSPPQEFKQAYPSGSPLPYFDQVAARGNVIFVELNLKYDSGDQLYEMWLDDCGLDGKQCTGTPTQVISSGPVNATNTCGLGTTPGIRSIWFNFSNGGCKDCQINFDEVVVRDRGILDAEIGFLTPFDSL